MLWVNFHEQTFGRILFSSSRSDQHFQVPLLHSYVHHSMSLNCTELLSSFIAHAISINESVFNETRASVSDTVEYTESTGHSAQGAYSSSLHIYYLIGATGTICGTSFVILSYLFSPKLRFHPSHHMFGRSGFHFILGLSFLTTYLVTKQETDPNTVKQVPV